MYIIYIFNLYFYFKYFCRNLTTYYFYLYLIKYIVNISKMRNRIKKWIEFNKLNSSQFAKKINVNRSNITHLLSGRNKPSIDFLDKLIRAYPEINANWLISGIGNMCVLEKEEKKEVSKPIQKVVIFYKDASFQEVSMDK